MSDLLRRNDHGRWCPHGHVGTGFSHETLKELHGKLIKLKAAKQPFAGKGKDEAVTTWVNPKLVAEVKFTEWISSGEVRHPVYPGLRADKRAADVFRESKSSLEHLSEVHLPQTRTGLLHAGLCFREPGAELADKLGSFQNLKK